MKKTNFTRLIFTAALFTTLGSYAQTSRLELNKGQKFEVNTVTSVVSVAEMMGQQMESNADNNSTELYEVKEIRNAETDITYSTTKLKAKMQAMGQEMDYDSDQKNNSGQLAEQLDKSIGKVKNMTIDASGKIIRQDKTEDETADGIMAMIGASLSNTSLFYSPLLGRELKPDMSIPDSVISNTAKMKSKIVGNYVVKSVENNIATILFTGDQTVSGIIEQMGMEMNMSGTSKVNSEIKMNIATGIVQESKTTIDGNNTIEAMGMSIPVSLKSTTSSTIKVM